MRDVLGGEHEPLGFPRRGFQHELLAGDQHVGGVRRRGAPDQESESMATTMCMRVPFGARREGDAP